MQGSSSNTKAQGKLGNIVAETLFPANVSQGGQTLGNNVSRKFCFHNNVSVGGQTGKHVAKHRESQMFPQQCFLVCAGLKHAPLSCTITALTFLKVRSHDPILSDPIVLDPIIGSYEHT